MKMKRLRLGAYLKDKRIGQDMTQAELAKKLKYSSPQFVSNWERGLSEPPIRKIKELIEILNIPKKEVVKLIIDETKDYYERNILQLEKKQRLKR